MTVIDVGAGTAPGAAPEPTRTGAYPRYLSVVIPTFNERENIPTLLAELARVLPAMYTEIIFVDDSTDDTPEVIELEARTVAIPVRVHHRVGGVGGLGGAVVEGLKLAQGAWAVVMDADLQHPVDSVLDLIAAGEKSRADLVVATRYADGGDRGGLSGGYRKLVSGGSTLITKLAFRKALAQVSDPMSGFFAVRTATLDVTTLRPLGYKILLELVVRTRPSRVAEVPYTFAPRYAGESKSSVKEGLRFLRHLAILRLGATRARMIGIGLIGASGVLPNLAVLAVLTAFTPLHYLAAAVVSNQVAIAWNFLLTDVLLFRSVQRQRSFAGRAVRYLLLGNADLVLRIPALALLVTRLHLGALLGNAITLAAAFLLRFLVIDRMIYARAATPARPDSAVGPVARLASGGSTEPPGCPPSTAPAASATSFASGSHALENS